MPETSPFLDPLLTKLMSSSGERTNAEGTTQSESKRRFRGWWDGLHCVLDRSGEEEMAAENDAASKAMQNLCV